MKMASNSVGSSRSRHSILSRVPIKELRELRVSIKRENIVTPVPAGPVQIQRSIIDPKQLVPLVHIWPGSGKISTGIFDRHDILINQEDVFSLIEADKPDPHKYHGFVTYNRSHSSTTSTRSLSRTPDRSRHKNGDRGRDNSDARRSVEKDRELNRDRDKRPYKGRPHSREREEGGYRKRSMTPLRPGEYRPSHSDLRRRSGSRGRDRSRDRYRTHSRRSRSLSVDYRKPSTSRKLSRSPRRSVSPSHDRGRPKSPRYDPSRRSRSPSKPDKSHYGDKRGRVPSPGYKDSSKRRSRSPSRYDREKRRSKSPHTRSSPGIYDRYSSRRRSHSPRAYDRYPSSDKRCRSPHPPIVTFSKTKSDYRRSSKSPGYERDRRYHHSRRRSRSRSPRRQRRSRSPHADRETDYCYYEGMPGAEYWIPGPIRPGFPAIPRYYPPAFFPRIPGAPIVVQPRIPMIPPYVAPYRQRLPVYNSERRPVKPAVPGPSGSEGTVSATGGGEEVPPATSGGQEEQSNVEVRDITDSDGNKTERKNTEESEMESSVNDGKTVEDK